MSENKNRFSVHPVDLKRLLRVEGFEIDDSTDHVKWHHSKYGILVGSFPKIKNPVPAGYVKDAYDAIVEAASLEAASIQTQTKSVELPLPFGMQLKAFRQGNEDFNPGDTVTFFYKDFPEFWMALKQSDLGEVALTRSISIVQRQFQPTFDKFQEMEEEFGIEMLRSDEAVFILQRDVGFEKKCEAPSSDDFVGHIDMALDEARQAALNFKEERELAIHILGDHGYQVTQNPGFYIVRDPRKPDLEEVKILIDFKTLVSRETTNALGRLQHRYPVEPRKVIIEPVANPIPVDQETAPEVISQEADDTPPLEVTEPHPVISQPLDLPEESEMTGPTLVTPEPVYSEPTQPERSRPGEVIVARAPRKIIPIAMEAYEDTFGGRIVRHRNERNMTEQALADAIIDVIQKQKSKRIDGDTIVQWESNKAVPLLTEEYQALVSILIEKNEKILDVDKEKARREFDVAYSETRALIYNKSREVRADNFGRLVNKYRRQRALTEDELGDELTERLTVKIEENLQSFDFLDIARMQAGKQLPSSPIVDAMIRVFNGATSGPLRTNPLHEDDVSQLWDAYETAKKTMEAANIGPKPQVTPEASQLRSELLALFVHKSGEPCSISEIIRISENFSPLVPADVQNHLSVKASQYGSMSEAKIKTVKEVLQTVMHELGADELKLKQFDQRFDQLTNIYLQWKRDRSQQIGPRPADQAAAPEAALA